MHGHFVATSSPRVWVALERWNTERREVQVHQTCLPQCISLYFNQSARIHALSTNPLAILSYRRPLISYAALAGFTTASSDRPWVCFTKANSVLLVKPPGYLQWTLSLLVHSNVQLYILKLNQLMVLHLFELWSAKIMLVVEQKKEKEKKREGGACCF